MNIVLGAVELDLVVYPPYILSFASANPKLPIHCFPTPLPLGNHKSILYVHESVSVSSALFSRSVVSDSLQPHALQHARLPCPSPTPRVYSNSCPLSWWCHPTISSSAIPFSFHLQSSPASGSFSNESVLHIRWPKYWSFSFSISPSNEYSGLISLRMDCLDLLVVQGTFKSLLQHHSSKASILQCSAFFIVQLSHPYMTTGKTTDLTRWTFVSKVLSLLFFLIYFFIEGYLLYRVLLFSVKLQHESAIGLHISPPFWNSL